MTKKRLLVLKYKVIYHGPAAEHNFPCPTQGCKNKAVLHFGSPGWFGICGECHHRYWKEEGFLFRLWWMIRWTLIGKAFKRREFSIYG